MVHVAALHATAVHVAAMHATAVHVAALHATAVHVAAIHVTAIHLITGHHVIDSLSVCFDVPCVGGNYFIMLNSQ